MKRTTLLAALLMVSHILFSQPFTEQTGVSLPGVENGSVAWGDYDNDGDLDILLTGKSGSISISKIYKNNGNNTFIEQTGISLPGVYNGSVAWGDYDRDDDLDILLTGNYSCMIYENNGKNTFTEYWRTHLPWLNNSSVAWGDYDNDGDLDILLTGYSVSDKTTISQIYENNGNNLFFEQTGISLTGVGYGSVAWGDYDNDGDLDILLTGSTGSSNISKIYKNNGNNTFTDQTEILLTGVKDGSVAWGDYDNDGYIDILLTGNTGFSRISKIYRNNGNNTFSEQTEISLKGVYESSVAWGDYDNDGYLDILLTGYSATDKTTISKIYKNNGNNTFTEQTGISLPGVRNGSVVWGDYDNDGDLDILLTGYTGADFISKIYRNESNKANTKPTAPVASIPIIDYNCAMLSWNKATDAQTPSEGLTYNLCIKKVSDDSLLMASMSDINSGFRKVVQQGNINHILNYTIQNLDCGEYEWYIQAVDHCFSGSVFSKGQNFNILAPLPPTKLVANATSISEVNLTWVDNSNVETGYIVERSIGNNQSFFPIDTLSSSSTSFTDKGFSPGIRFFYRVKAMHNENSSEYSNDADAIVIFDEQTEISLREVSNGSVAWGDYDDDGDLDILLTGSFVSKIYRNNGKNTFTEQTGISLPGVIYSSVAWGDYDNDGDLDILLTGKSGVPISKIFRNNGNNSFTEQTGISLTGVNYGSVAWGDYDNDGDLDILLTGLTNSYTCISKIYKNNGNNTFTEQTGISLAGVDDSSVAWGDYDNDGDLDILLTGGTGSLNYISKIYRNNGNNTFAEQTGISLTGVKNSSVAWGDYDNDGDLDILLAGDTNSGRISMIYRNNGNNTFAEQEGISLTNVSFSSVAWGDYDNDGNLDILLTGRTNNPLNTSKIYKNNGNNTFTEQTEISLSEVDDGSVAWGDYDNDGDLDILMTGWSSFGEISKIYKNEISTVNTPPSTPVNLLQTVNANSATLTWDKATDKETPQSGLSYNLFIKSKNDGKIIKSPLSDSISGMRQIVSIGNVGQNNSWTIKDLPEGIYSWSVQAIDHNFAGSLFAPSSIFSVGNPVVLSKPERPVGEINICSDSIISEYTITSIPGATSYSWSISPSNAGVITGDSIAVKVDWSDTFNGTAKISVIALNTSANFAISESSDSLSVVVKSLPNTGVISGDQTVCKGTSDHIYKVVSIAGADSYVWSLPQGFTGTSSSDSISVNYSQTATSGKITVKGINDCGEGAESSLSIQVNSLPVSAGAIVGNTVVCQGVNDQIYTVAEIDGASSYIWSLPIGVKGSSTTNNISVGYSNSATIYTIKVQGENSCGVGSENSIAVAVNTIPEKPIVTKSGNVLQSSATSGNQWYKQSELIAGADQKQITSTGDGQYYVIVTENGCPSEPSDVFTVTGVETLKLKGMVEVYPNPVSQNFSVVSAENRGTVDYELIDMLGKVIQKGNFIGKTVVETGGMVSGMYLLKVYDGKTTDFVKIIKE
jgi:predicted nucleotidyltransferase